MFELKTRGGQAKPALYSGLLEQCATLIHGERDWLANLANTASLIYHLLPGLNWAGFYLWKDAQLVLGPFQGKPACVRIDLGRGVCGTAARLQATVVVPDVHQFPGHIACDAASRSEVVVPLLRGARLLGVLDLDSPQLERFDQVDAGYLDQLVRLLVDGSDWSTPG